MQYDDEVQSKQFDGQTKHDPLDKYLPVTHVEHDYFVDEVHVKQLFVGKQHY